MRSARIRTHWKNPRREISMAEHAAAVAAAAWRVALNAAKNLHEQGFVYENDEQRLAVMREYLYFFIHAADRRAEAALAATGRISFTTQLAHACRRHYLENERDVMARENHAVSFVEQLNRRMAGYAKARFEHGQPGTSAYRALGWRVQDCLGGSQVNKWAQDQVMELDGPEAFGIFSKALLALNEAATRSDGDAAGQPS